MSTVRIRIERYLAELREAHGETEAGCITTDKLAVFIQFPCDSVYRELRVMQDEGAVERVSCGTGFGTDTWRAGADT